MITLNPETHRYENENGVEYTSITRIGKKYQPPFDPDGMIARACAKSRGIFVEEIQAEWKQKGTDATDKGHDIHKVLEDFITDKTITKGYEELIDNFKVFKKGNLTPKTKAEVLLYSDFYRVAGTADLIDYHSHKTNIFDYKTNQQITFHSKYNNYLLHNLSHLEDCTYNIYTIQLSLYARLLEMEGHSIGRLGILWIADNGITVYPVSYHKNLATQLLNNQLHEII